MKCFIYFILCLLLMNLSCSDMLHYYLQKPGGIFITGHDPDYHAYIGPTDITDSSQQFIRFAVSYVSFDAADPKILLVTDTRNPGGSPSGESDSRLGISAAGYSYDVADYGSGQAGIKNLAKLSFRDYDVIIVASDYGGWLRQEEQDILISRSAEIISYINRGGGIVVLNQCGGRSGSQEEVDPGVTENRYKFLPFIESIPMECNFNTNVLTEFGISIGLQPGDIVCNSHSILTDIGGMEIVDYFSGGNEHYTITAVVRGRYVTEKGVVE